MATNARFDGLQGAGASVPAVVSKVLSDIVVVRLLDYEFSEIN